MVVVPVKSTGKMDPLRKTVDSGKKAIKSDTEHKNQMGIGCLSRNQKEKWKMKPPTGNDKSTHTQRERERIGARHLYACDITKINGWN